MTDAWTQTMDPNAWICMNCGKRRVDGDFPDYVCPGSWNGGVCEPRVLTPLDSEYEGPYKVKARRLKPVGSGEVVVSRTDLEAALNAMDVLLDARPATHGDGWATRLRAVLNQEGNQ